jgi:hypothetical protein
MWLEALSHGAGPKKILVTLGYSGWSAGQLEEEIGRNGWINVVAEPGVIFDTPVEQRYDKGAVAAGDRPAHAVARGGACMRLPPPPPTLLSRFRFRHQRVGVATGNTLHAHAHAAAHRRGRAMRASRDRPPDRRMAARCAGRRRAVPPDGAPHDNTARAQRFARQLHGRFGCRCTRSTSATPPPRRRAGARDVDAASARDHPRAIL